MLLNYKLNRQRILLTDFYALHRISLYKLGLCLIFVVYKIRYIMTQIYRTNDNKRIEILPSHVRTGGGNFKGVCVSACLSYFGITPDLYKFTWSKRAGNASTIAVFRRFGWAVRSRKSTLLKGTKTVGSVRRAIAQYEDYTEDVMYYVHVAGHVMLLNSKGETVVDTAPRKVDRRRVLDVKAIFKS